MKKLSTEALDVLATGVSVQGHELRLTAGQLDRKLYVEVNEALEALGGKWNRKAKAHLFTEEPADALDQVLVDGGFHDMKRDLEQFFTPPELAKQVAALADVGGHRVLEPSAGHGSLALAASDAGAAHVECIERDPKCVAVLTQHLFPVTQADFLTWTSDWRWARVVTNPPFSRQRDIEHVTHAYSFLASGGLLVAIMSAGVTFRRDRKAEAFRRLVDQASGSIKALPEKAFASSGTNVNAVLVTLRRS